MGEFQEKVEELKNTMQNPGFTVPDELGEDVASENEPIQEISPEDQAPEKRSERRRNARRESLKHKLDQARYESKLKDEQNQLLLAQLQETERRLSEKQYQVEEAVNNDHNRYLNSLVLREQSILSELKVAKEEGDTQKEVELTRDMAQVVSEKSTYDLYKSQIHTPQRQSRIEDEYYPQPYVPQAIYQDPYQDYEEPENEHYENWLDRNQWADPHSSGYSQKLRSEVEDLSSRLDGFLRNKGVADLIGTPEYYDSLDTLMRDEHDTSNERTPQNSGYSGGSMVAPVSRSGSSLSDQYVSRNPNSTRRGVSLTKEEYAIARNLQIPMPNGRMHSAAEAIELYKQGKRNVSGIDPLHPNRLTIPE